MDVQSQNLALITLKERCHFLKQQLKAVDEENIKLKVELAHSKPTPLPSNGLIAEVEILKKQKEQLSNQVLILATENNNMWSRLSRLTVVNRNLTKRFTKITDTLEKYGISSVMSDSEADQSVTVDSQDYRKNLEEMSLRLIDDIKLEKTELERQYAEMVTLHKNEVVITGQELAFSSMEPDEDTVMSGLRKHTQKMNQLRQSLLMQQTMLVSALEKLKTSKCFGAVSQDKRDACTETVKEETVRSVSIVPAVEVESGNPDPVAALNEQICPLCGAHIPGTPDKFCDHVSGHFEHDDETDHGLNSFVHIP